MSSRIEQIIEEIEEYIDGCPFKPLSTSKIIVNKDHIDELLRELRMKTPDEISVIRRLFLIRMRFLQMRRQKQTVCWRKRMYRQTSW